MLEWDDHLLIGNERIDFEHRIFFDLISHLDDAREGDAGRLTRLLEEVVLYAKFHFKSEENLMQDLGYPDLHAHRLQHYALVEGLGNKLAGFQMGRHSAEEIEKFLVAWFVDHVTHEDTKVSAYLAQASATPASPPTP